MNQPTKSLLTPALGFCPNRRVNSVLQKKCLTPRARSCSPDFTAPRESGDIDGRTLRVADSSQGNLLGVVRDMPVLNLRWVIAIAVDSRGEDIATPDKNRTNTPLFVSCLVTDIDC
jgi:hypothetical protein